MNKILKGLALSTAIAASLSFGSLSTDAQQNSRESASGHGSYAVGPRQKRQFSFSATRLPDGTVNGNATLINPAFDFRAQFDITCLRVTTSVANPETGEIGSRADFGGVVRKSNDPGLPEGTRGFFTVFDYGEPGKNRDTISPVFFDFDVPASNCEFILTDPTAPSNQVQIVIESGNIQVRSGATQ